MSKKSSVGGALLLLFASFIWGVAFVAQTTGMEHVGPFTFTVVRSMLAAIFLFPCSFLYERRAVRTEDRLPFKTELKAGLLLGVIMLFAANFQQVGLQYTTAGKAGFITSLYIVLVPVIGLFFKRRPHPVLWLCVLVALAGFYFLSINEDFSVSKGDIIMLFAALCFAFQILCVDHFAARANVVRLCCLQFFFLSLFSIPLMFIFEKPQWSDILAAWLPLVYAGVLSGGVAYTLQMLGQKRIEPTAASLLCSPESVFAALAGWVLLSERMSARELLGCALVFLAVICSQLPWGSFFRKRKNGDIMAP